MPQLAKMSGAVAIAHHKANFSSPRDLRGSKPRWKTGGSGEFLSLRVDQIGRCR
jgi:hypothetical protein